MTSSLRQRTGARNQDAEDHSADRPAAKPACPVKMSGGISWLRKAIVVLMPAYFLCVLFDVLETPDVMARGAWDALREKLGLGQRVFTREQLKTQGTGMRPLLSILGEVFDVSKGAKHYGPDGPYRGFTGKDASRSFVTGDFSETGLTDDVSGLEPSQCLGIEDWLYFYKKDKKKYPKRGLLEGKFYDSYGEPTNALKAFKRCAEEGKRDKDREEAEKKLYPNCYSKWTSAEGGRVWCEDPKKVPRKIPSKKVHGSDIRSHHRATGTGHGSHRTSDDAASHGEEKSEYSTDDAGKVKGRCACFDFEYAVANEHRLLSYKGCDGRANSCVSKAPDARRG